MSLFTIPIPGPPSSPEWLAARAPFFNASMAACLWERHEYVPAATYALEKLGRIPPDEENDAMRRGSFLEDGIAQWFSHDTGEELWRPTTFYGNGVLLASADRTFCVPGVDDDDMVLVEIKTCAGYVDEPKQMWIDQCQAQLACTKAIGVHLVWMDSSLTKRSVYIERDEDHIAAILQLADQFMAAISFGIIPDWITLSADHISIIYPDPDGIVEVDDYVASVVAEYDAYKDAINHLERERATLRDEIANVFADANVMVHNGRKIATFNATAGRKTRTLRTTTSGATS